jgi:NAD(P)-dependent dehydrogenase (short-subunit alcohol dehydrogenase family)/aryl carrier-like protein
VAPGRREDHDALLKELVAGGEVPEVVLHLWNLGRERGADPAQAALADEVRGFWSLLHLAQACGKQNLGTPLRLAVVSSNLQRVTGEDFLCPGKATLLGPSRIIPQEYPHIRCASIDVLLPVPASPAEEDLIERLLAEAAGGLPDPVVAYRGQGRFLLGYESVRVGAAPPERLRFRTGGTYLITGGLGGLGLTFADFLARDFQGRLALLGLSPLPPREEWADWLARHDERNRVSEKIRKVQELEALGAEVLVLAVDIADAAQVAAAVGQVLARFGAVHGVIHAAGMAGGGVIQLKSPDTAARVLAPKVRGTLALDAALAGLPLDFLVLCSSTIAVAGGLGQVDYCAANSFLDAFAHDRALRGDGRTVSINWGAWQEVGMAVATGLTGGPGQAAAAPAGRRDVHPLLDRCLRETAEQTVYETDFSAARQWVLADHRILGRPALPGTSYLEMARAAFEDHAAAFERQAGEAGVEVRDVLFLSPLMLDEAEVRPVQTTLEPDGERFAFRIASRPPAAAGEGGAPAWQAHARGKVGPLAAAPAARLDLDAIRRRCAREIDVAGPVMSDGAGVVYWGPRWQSLKRVHIGEGEGLALLELPAEFAADLAAFALHPALLDVATGLIGFLEEGTHLPISYQRLMLHKPLTARLYSYLRKRVEDGGGKETVAVDVTLMDETGEALVEVERFVMKRVTEAAGAFLRSSAPARAEAAPPTLPAPGAPGEEAAAGHAAAPRAVGADGILSREGVEVLRRVLARGRETPQIVASAKDLNALLAQVRALDRGSLMDRPDLARGARATHPRPSLPTPYLAPRDAAEGRLAEIFQNALGIQEVGVHDNFFDLGGDSIVGIQVVARANEAGLALSPDQLFEHQTIAELAALIGPPEAAAPPPMPPDEAVPVLAGPPEPLAPFADAGLGPGELDKVLTKLKALSARR